MLFVCINLIILGLVIKLYTEYFKNKAMSVRASSPTKAMSRKRAIEILGTPQKNHERNKTRIDTRFGVITYPHESKLVHISMSNNFNHINATELEAMLYWMNNEI